MKKVILSVLFFLCFFTTYSQVESNRAHQDFELPGEWNNFDNFSNTNTGNQELSLEGFEYPQVCIGMGIVF